MPPMETLRVNLSSGRDTLVLACRALGTGKTHLVCTLYSSPGPHKAASCRSPAIASAAASLLFLSILQPRSSPPAPPSWDPGVSPPGLCRASGGWGFPTLHSTKEDCDVRSHVVPPSFSPEEQCKPEVEAPQAPQEAPLDPGPAERSAPSVYETLQCRLSSLEAMVAAWRRRSRSFPRPRGPEAPEALGDEGEAAGPGQQEAARLMERNAWLRLALGNREDELAFTQASLRDAQAEKETLQRQVSW